MVITKLVKQKRHPGRINLYVDGVFITGLQREVIVRYGLRKGDTISHEMLDKIKGYEELYLARFKAMRLLKSRLRSEHELRDRLRNQEFSSNVIEKIVKDFHSIGLIDDERFARAFVHDALLKKASGRRLLNQQLITKGVARDLINNALDDILPEKEEDSLLIQSAKSYISRLKNSRKKTDEQKILRRTVQYLLRRGFSFDKIIKAVKPMFRNDYYFVEE